MLKEVEITQRYRTSCMQSLRTISTLATIFWHNLILDIRIKKVHTKQTASKLII
jgi:hypothetical protein